MAEKSFKWSSQPDVDPGGTGAFREVPGGRQARPHLLARKTGVEAAVLAADMQSRQHLVAEYYKKGIRTQDAVMAGNGRGILLGTISEAGTGHLFGADYEEDGDRWSTVAVRLGNIPVNVSMGLWVPDEAEWYPAEEMTLAEATIPVDEIAAGYPYTPLIDFPGQFKG